MFRSPSLLLTLTLLLTASCGTVRSSWVRADYALHDRTETLHLGVFTDPAPAGSAKACALMSLIARRYVNQKRDFIVKANGCAPKPAHCEEGLEGLLRLKPVAELDSKRAKVHLSVDAVLTRCSDGEDIWRGRAKGSWPFADKHVAELAENYSEELGPEVVPYVPASFYLLRALLDTLPRPILMGEEAVMEKIELGE